MKPSPPKGTPKILVPTTYRGCIITPAPTTRGGFDVFEASGRWFHVETQKQAKWWASVHTNLQTRLAEHRPRILPTPIEDHTP